MMFRGGQPPAARSVFVPLVQRQGSNATEGNSWVSSPVPSNGIRQTNGLNSGKGPAHDQMAFLAPQYFAMEGEESSLRIGVIRIGSLHGSCSVDYYTKDVTALAGQKYEATEGTVSFAEGETVKYFDVEIMEDDSFDTTLEFQIFLHNPQNCELEHRSFHTRVMIIDRDLFPASHLKEPIEQGESALYDIGGSLLKAFFYFCYNHVPTVRWKSWAMVLLAQLDNLYYLMTIELRIYMVDKVLALKNDTTLDELWFKGDRGKTMFMIGIIFVAPNFILLGVSYFEMMVLEMGFNIRYHLRVNLFRKYLNYTHESRKQVPVQDLKASIMEDIPDVVSDGYLAIFDIFAMAGKLVMVAAFMIHKHPESALYLLVYPALIVISLHCTYKKRLKLSAATGDGEGDTLGWLIHASHSAKLINAYKRRGFVVSKFEAVLKNQRKLVMALKSFNFWNEQLIPWITLMVIGIYMSFFGQLVVAGTLSLGSFLATINIYKDLGDRFGKVQSNVEAMVCTIEPLTGLTSVFNMEIDTMARKAFAKDREEYVAKWLSDHNYTNSAISVFDMIPIQLQDVTVEHSPALRKPTSLEAPQGSIVHVIGRHATGKGTILDMLSDVREPSTGKILCPPHVRILNVTMDKLFVECLGFHGNLVFGLSEHRLHDPDPERAHRICSRLGLNKKWMMKALDDGMQQASDVEVEEDEEDEDSDKDDDPGADDSWMDKLSVSENKLFQLARAFIFDPEVLIVHKPVDGFDNDVKERVLSLMREFVDQRGLEIDDATIPIHRRRPHTIIFSGGASTVHPISDILWRVDENQVTAAMGPMTKR